MFGGCSWVCFKQALHMVIMIILWWWDACLEVSFNFQRFLGIWKNFDMSKKTYATKCWQEKVSSAQIGGFQKQYNWFGVEIQEVVQKLKWICIRDRLCIEAHLIWIILVPTFSSVELWDGWWGWRLILPFD